MTEQKEGGGIFLRWWPVIAFLVGQLVVFGGFAADTRARLVRIEDSLSETVKRPEGDALRRDVDRLERRIEGR